MCDLVTIPDIFRKTADGLGWSGWSSLVAEFTDSFDLPERVLLIDTFVTADLSVDGELSFPCLVSPFDSKLMVDLVIHLGGMMSGKDLSISEADFVSSVISAGSVSIVSADEFAILALRHSFVFFIPLNLFCGTVCFLSDFVGFFFETGLQIILFNICFPFSSFVSSSSFICSTLTGDVF